MPTSRRTTRLLIAAGALLALVLTTAGISPVLAGEAAPAAVPKALAPATFTHPGVLVSRAQLDFVRAKVQAGAQPWTSAYDQMMASRYASLSRTPKPRAMVECGSVLQPEQRLHRRAPGRARRVHQRAGLVRHRRRPVRAEGDRSSWTPGRPRIKDHTNSNAPLQTGWAGSVWPRAAEIIRYTYTGWRRTSDRFATMLRNVYLPKVINGSHSNGNWELTHDGGRASASRSSSRTGPPTTGRRQVPRPRARPSST